MELTRPLTELRAGLLDEAGGKAANLGEMISAGLPVPPGFCVTTEAYRQAAESSDDLRRLLSETPADADPAEFAGAARTALSSASMPEQVRDAVLAAYRELGSSTPVAVRSSATAEDLPYASFAGQQDTYLNVVGPEALLDAVQRCWASLWTERAVSYRGSNSIDHAAVRLAVVVQRMVDARVAGVMFTANPVTGRRGELVIDASPGLGESVVSGAVNPDRFVVDAATRAIVSRQLGDKRLSIRSVAGGGTERVTLPGALDEPCLTDDQLRELVALGMRVQTHYDAPQDTEWALDDAGRLWLTQARPITTLYPLPEHAGADRSRVYFNGTLAQGLTRPITPMGLAAFRVLSSGLSMNSGGPVRDPLAGSANLVVAGQRLFIDVTGALSHPVGSRLMPRMLDLMEARSAVVLRELAHDHPVTGSWWTFLRRVLPVVARYRMPLRMVDGILRPARARAALARFGEELRRRIEPPPGLTPAQRLDHVEHILATTFLTVVGTVGPVALGSAFAPLGLANVLLRGISAQGELAGVLRGLPHNVTTEMDLELWALATKLRADEPTAALLRDRSAAELADRYREATLPAPAMRGVADFLDHYGHRAVAEIDLGLPRWSDDPSYLFGVLANYLRSDDPAAAADQQFAAGGRAAQETVAHLVAAARRRGRWRGSLVAFCLDRTRQLAGLRELPKYLMIQAFAVARRELAEVGRELSARGRLERPDDVFWLDLAQARRALDDGATDLTGLITQRRAEYDQELRRRQLPRVLLSDGTEPEAVARGSHAADGDLVGTAASAGTVTGTARVVLDPSAAHLLPGEILIAPSTDPGWTPLFLTAGGLVMEMGGANSHGAVVAREYGIPAVVGVAEATTRIHTGQQVTVHGADGRVSIDAQTTQTAPTSAKYTRADHN
jgi:pyruvate,water dikinase